jgi:flagellar motor switch protein FliN/FliY
MDSMPDESAQIGQNEIEDLLRQANPGGAAPPAAGQLAQSEIEALMGSAPGGAGGPSVQTSQPAGATPRADTADGTMAQGDIEYLLNQAQEALRSVDAPHNPGPLAGIAPFRLEEFGGAPASSEVATLELIRDVELDLKIELGRTQMHLEDVLKLRKGSVVPLDKLAGDPVDIYVNGRLIARGEVLVLNDNFCVRVAELITAESARAS